MEFDARALLVVIETKRIKATQIVVLNITSLWLTAPIATMAEQVSRPSRGSNRYMISF